ncbi:hypothetical protein EAW55_13400 [Legionella jordanis]|nr:hypothetical protein EAW55_13400 [Legionella jordanis]
MSIFRDLIIFVAGAEFFHTLVHIYLRYLGSFPMNLKYMVLTSTLNNWAIIVNAVITIVLILWTIILGSRVKRNQR